MSDLSSRDYSEINEGKTFSTFSLDTIVSLQDLENSEHATKIHLTDESLRLQHTQKMTETQELTLERCSVTGRVMEALCAGMYEGIGVLNLTGCYLGRLASIETLVSALSRCPTLRTLILPHNHLNDEQISQIANVFPRLTGLQVLDLEANELQQCPNLLPLASLCDLNLKNNCLNKAAWDEVISQCVQLKVKTLRLWRVEISEEMLQKLGSLSENGLDCCELLDVQLPASAALSAFDFYRCKMLSVRNVQLSSLGRLELVGLRCLDLSYCGIRSQGIQQIAKRLFDLGNTLEFLGLSGNFCDEASAQTMSRIPQLVELTTLELASFCTSTAAFKALLQGLASTSLQVLDLSGNLLQSDADTLNDLVKAFARCKGTLRKLNLADNCFQSLGPFGLELTALESLSLERTELKHQRETLICLENCRLLKTLNLGSVDLSSSEQEPTVAFCLHPEHLFLPNTSPSLALLSMLISQASSLVELDLSGARLSVEVLEGFAELLPGSVEVLNLAYTEWRDVGCEVLLRCGGKLDKLKNLNLSCNGISDAGVEKLMEAWERLSKLRVLSLAGNIIKGLSFQRSQPLSKSDLAVLDLRKNPFELSPFPASLFPCLVELLIDKLS